MKIENPSSRYFDKKPLSSKIRQKGLSKFTYQLFDIAKKERDFLLIVLILIVLCALFAPYKPVAMWVGFALASYSAIANDSIQTLGTFIASNSHRKWWYLWIFIGLIFVGTVTYSWVMYEGDVSYQRLTSKGFSEAPQAFSFLQLFAPVALLVLTRIRIPVSTTFLLLNIFATDANALIGVVKKSFYGYFVSFFIAIVIWYLASLLFSKYLKVKPGKGWVVLQWITSGCLWSAWLMQDAANTAVFLPRSLNFIEFLIFTVFIFFGLGLLFYLKGDRLQKVVSEKAGITDVRAATLVDVVYVSILYYFMSFNNVPMSTTWVFIGLLGGRELAISLTKRKAKKRRKSLKKSFKFIKRDLSYAFLGLLISIILAISVNPVIKKAGKELWGNLLTLAADFLKNN